MCKISIITPVYKVEEYLPKCIDSILEQTFTDFEVWIVDDGSPDRCGAIADAYAQKDGRVHVIHKENGGAPSARNAGIERAAGEYLYFPDSDDWLAPGYLQELYETAVKTGAQMVVSGYTLEYFERNRAQSYAVSVPACCYADREQVRHNVHRYFDNMMMAVPWNKLYRADYIREKGLRFPSLKWDDLHFNMEVIKDIDRVAVSSSYGYHFFRSRQGSETTLVFDGFLYEKRREQFAHIRSVYRYWRVKDHKVWEVLYGYYAARLLQCVQEIAISGSREKRAEIDRILRDPLTRRALRYGKIESRILRAAALPMKMNSVEACLLMGRTIGFIKIHMSPLFYKLKALSVNKARVCER